MKRWFALAVVAAFAAACSDRPAPTHPGGPSFVDVAQGQSHVHVMPLKAQAFGLGAAKPGGGGSKGGPGIFYHGGPIFYHTKVVAVYWGNSPIYNGGPGAGPGRRGPAPQEAGRRFPVPPGGSPPFHTLPPLLPPAHPPPA